MSENRKYKLKYDELREGNPTKSDSGAVEDNKLHDTPSPSRTICFAWPEGRKQFFSYGYLVSGELNVDDEQNVITLHFTSDVVTLKGYSLDELFSQLVKQAPSLILQSDERYSPHDETYSITDIIVTPII